MKISSVILMATVVAAVATPLLLHHRAEIKLEPMENTLRLQGSRLAQLTAAQIASSHAAAQSESAPILSDAQARELARLRREAGQLRETAQAVDRLRAANNKIIDANEAKAAALEQAKAAPNYWPKDQLVNSGYATPEAALRTTLWAMSHADFQALITSITPAVRADYEKARQQDPKGAADMEAQFAEGQAQMIGHAAGFRILEQESPAPDKIMLKVALVGAGATLQFDLQQVGNDWKVADVHPTATP